MIQQLEAQREEVRGKRDGKIQLPREYLIQLFNIVPCDFSEALYMNKYH